MKLRPATKEMAARYAREYVVDFMALEDVSDTQTIDTTLLLQLAGLSIKEKEFQDAPKAK